MPDEIVDEFYAAQDPDSPGRLLEASMRAGMAKIRGMNWSRLARESGVSRGTFYKWFVNEQTPSIWTLERVAKVLELEVRDLWDAYSGRDQIPPSTAEAINKLIERLDRDHETMEQVLDRLRVLSSDAIGAGVSRLLSERTPASPDTPLPRRPRRKPPRPAGTSD